MFFPFLLVASISIGLIQLGALSVWVTVLALSLKVMFVVAITAAAFFAFRRIIRQRKP